MRALTFEPGKAGSTRLEDVSEPALEEGSVLVQTTMIGICGTDRGLIDGHVGEPPPGEKRMIIGHESLGRVLEAPTGSGLKRGDLVVGIVRRPDPVPCPNCAVGEWDMCQNGRYTERGILRLQGFCSERFRIEPEFAVKIGDRLDRLGVLVEPASIVAKAWEHIERIGHRSRWAPKKVLVTGAGPIGLLAAMMGVQRGLEVHVLDKVTEGPKPELVRDLGATYHSGAIQEACVGANILIECTGVGQLVFDAMQCTAPNGIVCLTGIPSGKRSLDVDSAALNRSIVLENDVVFGSVNANRRHFESAVEALEQADPKWLDRMITRRVPLEHWMQAILQQSADIKTVIEFSA